MKQFKYRGLSATSLLAICLLPGVSSCDASWDVKYNTSNKTVTSYDSKTGYRLTEVSAKDKATEKTWSMLMECSGQAGAPGQLRMPPSPEERADGEELDLSESTFQEVKVAFREDGTPLTPLPDTNAMRAKLQADCDNRVNPSAR